MNLLETYLKDLQLTEKMVDTSFQGLGLKNKMEFKIKWIPAEINKQGPTMYSESLSQFGKHEFCSL